MPFTVGWYDTGILVDCTDTLDTDATDRLLEVVRSALERCAVPTNVILDWRGSRGDPMLRHECTKRVASLVHPKLGLVAAVNSDPLAGLQVGLRYERRDYLYLTCTSLEEAVRLLRERLPPSMKRLHPAQNISGA